MTGNRKTNEESSRLSRRTFLGAAGAGIAGLSGCLTLSPKVSVSGLADSDVFETVSVREPWASGRVVVSIKFAPTATTELGVRGVTVIGSSGTEFDTAAVQSGQLKKSVFFPVGKSTLTAVDFDGKTVDSVDVTVRGTKIV
ncbi:twin-arginine translocation signal domain-containing protein [Haladaptatus sp. DFWS20]|uniref:twin-arginine translocation signal domain-containing protein n=1 Tax=Haladaptatus sp. DFWS20 TaxID=3403467 RepID=UPI003EB88A16